MTLRSVLVAISLFFLLSTKAHSQDTDWVGQASFQPIGIPLQISFETNGTLSIIAATDIVTPLGVFSFGSGVNYLPSSAHVTCFVIRFNNSDNVYCIGTSGTIRLESTGASTVDISRLPGASNAFLIEISSGSGEIRTSFIPSPNANELARIVGAAGLNDLVLRKDRSLVLDALFDTTLVSTDDQNAKVYLLDNIYETPSNYTARLVIQTIRDGKINSRYFDLKGAARLQAIWFVQFCNTINGSPNSALTRNMLTVDKTSNYASSKRYNSEAVTFWVQYSSFSTDLMILQTRYIESTSYAGFNGQSHVVKVVPRRNLFSVDLGLDFIDFVIPFSQESEMRDFVRTVSPNSSFELTPLVAPAEAPAALP